MKVILIKVIIKKINNIVLKSKIIVSYFMTIFFTKDSLIMGEE